MSKRVPAGPDPSRRSGQAPLPSSPYARGAGEPILQQGSEGERGAEGSPRGAEGAANWARYVPNGRILIIRPSAVGDVLMTLCGLVALRRTFPQAHIGYLVEDRARDLIVGHPCVDRVHLFPRKRWLASLRHPSQWRRTWAEMRAFAAEMRRERYDASLDIQGNLKGAVLGLMAGARVRIGYSSAYAREGNHLFTHVHVTPGPADRHRAENFIALPRFLGADMARAGYVLPDSPASRERMRAWLAALSPAPLTPTPLPQGERGTAPLTPAPAPLTPPFAPRTTRGRLPAALPQGERGTGAPFPAGTEGGAAYAVIHPGTSEFGRAKRWPAERFGAVAQGLAALGLRTVVAWGPGERPVAEQVAAASAGSAVVGPETRSILDLAELIRGARLFVGCDSGPMHLSSAVGTPCVAIFGPHDPAVYGPFLHPRFRVVHRRRGRVGKTEWVTAEDVLEAAREVVG